MRVAQKFFSLIYCLQRLLHNVCLVHWHKDVSFKLYHIWLWHPATFIAFFRIWTWQRCHSQDNLPLPHLTCRTLGVTLINLFSFPIGEFPDAFCELDNLNTLLIGLGSDAIGETSTYVTLVQGMSKYINPPCIFVYKISNCYWHF